MLKTPHIKLLCLDVMDYARRELPRDGRSIALLRNHPVPSLPGHP
jgi:hypothetical protein